MREIPGSILNLLLALTSGLLLAIIHPNVNAVWLAPFALAPLLIALSREWRPRRRFFLGYAAGAVYWGVMCYWIHYVVSVNGGLGNAAGTLVFLLFCLMPSFNMAFFGLLAGIVIHKRYAVPAVAALWVAAERIPTPFGFMWLKLGDAATGMGIPMRLAPFTGVYGISFVFAMMSTALALILLRRNRIELSWLASLVILYFLPALPVSNPSNESAVVVQPNLAEERTWTRAEVDAMEDRLVYLSLQSALSPGQPKARLILWPEAPAPIYYYDDPHLKAQLETLARVTQTNLIIGTVGRTGKGDPLNSGLMLSPSGEPIGRYDKVFLVPFGEYVPKPFGFANKITNEIGDFVPGDLVRALPGGVGLFICYESAFPHLIRRFAANGASVFVNLSNDGYFGHSAAREQHLRLVRMRAAENRRWIIRSTNDGITAAVDPAGQVTERLQPYIQTTGRLNYSDVRETTWYTRHGDWFAWCCAGFAALALFASQIPEYKGGALRAG